MGYCFDSFLQQLTCRNCSIAVQESLSQGISVYPSDQEKADALNSFFLNQSTPPITPVDSNQQHTPSYGLLCTVEEQCCHHWILTKAVDSMVSQVKC